LYIKALIYFGLPFVLVIAWSILVGHSPLLFAGIWYHILFVRVPNPAGSTMPLFHDVLFYIKYLLHFEPAVLLFAWLFGLALVAKRAFNQSLAQLRKPDFITFLAIISVLYFCVISALPKAPRGLLICWPMCITIIIFAWKQLKMNALVQYAIVFGLFGWSLVNVWQNVWQYRKSNQVEVAEKIKEQKADNQFITTVGINVFQHFSAQPVRFAFSQEQTQDFQYLLLDDYRLLAALPIFKDSLTVQNAGYQLIGQWHDPVLLSPILWLEHCEFTNVRFTDALNKRDSLAKQPYHLRLYKKSTANEN
jgi:hypothetical protein